MPWIFHESLPLWADTALVTLGVLVVGIAVLVCDWLVLLRRSRFVDRSGRVMPGSRPPFPSLPFLPSGDLDAPTFHGRALSTAYDSDIYVCWSGRDPVVMIGNPRALKDFFRDQVRGHTRDFTPTGLVFQALFHDCLGCFEGEQWLAARKVFNPPFSVSSVMEAAPGLDAVVREWFDTVASPSATTSCQLASSGCDEIPLRALVRFIFGEDPSGQDRITVRHLLLLHRQLLQCMFHPSTRIPGYRLASCTRANRLINRFIACYKPFFDAKLVQCRSKAKCMKNSAMARLVAAIDADANNKPPVLTIPQLYRSLYEMVFLNLDLAGRAVSWAVAHVAQHQHVQQQLVAEINTLCPDDQVDRSALFRTVQSKLPYLDTVCKESARVQPALAVLLPPETMTSRTVIDGYSLPKGTKVAIDSFTLNFNPRHWQDPDTFNPDRFQTPDFDRFAFFRFGNGQRMCLGYRFADFLTKLTVVAVLRKHNVQLLGSATGKTRSHGMVNLNPTLPDVTLQFSPRLAGRSTPR